MSYHERQRKSIPTYRAELPDIHVDDPHLHEILEAFKRHLEEREGKGRSEDNQFVRMKDLETMGIIKQVNGVVKGGGVTGEFTSADGKTIRVTDGVVTYIK